MLIGILYIPYFPLHQVWEGGTRPLSLLASSFPSFPAAAPPA